MATRTAVQVLREIALVKSQTKGDADMQKALLAPLEAELKGIAEAQKAHAEAQKAQMSLPLSKGGK